MPVVCPLKIVWIPVERPIGDSCLWLLFPTALLDEFSSLFETETLESDGSPPT